MDTNSLMSRERYFKIIGTTLKVIVGVLVVGWIISKVLTGVQAYRNQQRLGQSFGVSNEVL